MHMPTHVHTHMHTNTHTDSHTGMLDQNIVSTGYKVIYTECDEMSNNILVYYIINYLLNF